MRFVSVLRQLGVATGVVALGLTSVGAAYGQANTPTSQQASSPQTGTKPPIAKHPRARKRMVKPEAAPVVETRPPDPPPPDWPANAKPVAPRVGWDGRDLSISAANSSLKQILQDVSTATGVKVEGMGNDQRSDTRIYGSYGPAAPRDVLGKLLEGSGYNVMMVGDQGEGTPRELVLTAKTGHSGSPQSQTGAGAQNQVQDEDQQEEPEQPELPPIQQRPFGNPQAPGQGLTPQQLLQEMQQRQQQLQQQQQQQPPGGQPPND